MNLNSNLGLFAALILTASNVLASGSKGFERKGEDLPVSSTKVCSLDTVRKVALFPIDFDKDPTTSDPASVAACSTIDFDACFTLVEEAGASGEEFDILLKAAFVCSVLNPKNH